jgi:hypothetical protein
MGAEMKKIFAIGGLLALSLAGSAGAQTFPKNYASIPELQFPVAGDSQPVLPTDFIFTQRLQQTSPGQYSIGDYGPLPVTEFAFAADVARTNDRVNALQRFAFDARREARQGIAATMAISSASMPSAPGRTSWTVNAADFRDEQAVGGSIAHRFNTRVPFAFTAGFAISVSGSGEKGGRVGFAGEF